MITGETFNLQTWIAEGRASLRTLNSLTKYPEIPTYHRMGERGLLTELADTAVDEDELKWPPVARFHGTVELTEKIDGTNARVIILPDCTTIVGSREELLWARGDLIPNPQLRIVETLRNLDVPNLAALKLASSHGRIVTVYGEVYGADVGPAGKRYAGSTGASGFRVFDVCTAPTEYLAWDAESAARWRQQGGQQYFSSVAIDAIANSLGVGRVPYLSFTEAEKLPKTISETAEWLERYVPRSRASLRAHDDLTDVRPEGIVLRGVDSTNQRRLLAKARFEDYARTLRARG